MMNSIHIHLILGHVPVVGTVLGAAQLLIGIARQSTELIWMSLALFVLNALIGIGVFVTGQRSETALKHLTRMAEAPIRRHRSVASIATFVVEALGAPTRAATTGPATT